jgi:hypothetical protein
VSTELAALEAWEPMTAQECAQLIGVAAAADNRVPQPSPEMLKVWWAILRRVPAEAGLQAIADWYGSERYRESRESITPADIAGWWRDRRRHAEERREAPPVDVELIRSGVDRVFAALAARKALAAGLDAETAVDVADSEAQSRRLMRSVPCPWEPCRAPVTRPCVGPRGVPLSGDQVHDLRRQSALDTAASSHA